MKIELEILDKDLDDRKILIEMRVSLENKIKELSDFGRNTLFDELNRLRGSLEWAESMWLKCQKERLLNLFSQMMNVGRDKLGDEDWHDD